MKHETIVCPFCGNGHAHITYEENRVYQMNCPDCHNAIFHQDVSWDAAVAFFKHITITDDDRLEQLCAAEKDVRLVILPCKVGDTVYVDKRTIYDGWRTKGVSSKIAVGKVVAFSKNKQSTYMKIEFSYTQGAKTFRDRYVISAFGKTVFLTRPEAEAALASAKQVEASAVASEAAMKGGGD